MPRGRIPGVLLLATLVAAAGIGLHSRPFLLTQLRLSGMRQVTPAEVQVDIGLRPDTYAWQVRPWVVRRRLLRDPMIAAARVSVLWPGGLAIAIRERLPVALLAVPGGLWEVDAHRRLLRYLPAAGGLPQWEATAAGKDGVGVRGLPKGLPLITGVALVDPVAGRVASGSGVRRALGVASGLGAAAQSLVSRLVWASGGVTAVTRGGVSVDYGDGTAARQKTEILLGVLGVAARERVRLLSVDLRAPSTPSARLQPGSPPLVYDGQTGG